MPDHNWLFDGQGGEIHDGDGEGDETLWEEWGGENEENVEPKKESKTPNVPVPIALMANRADYVFVVHEAPRKLKLTFWTLCKRRGMNMGDAIVELIRKCVESNGALLDTEKLPPNQKGGKK